MEFALLEPLNLEEIGAGRILQRRDSRVEVAMLLQEPRKLLPQLALFIFGHGERWVEGPKYDRFGSSAESLNRVKLSFFGAGYSSGVLSPWEHIRGLLHRTTNAAVEFGPCRV